MSIRTKTRALSLISLLAILMGLLYHYVLSSNAPQETDFNIELPVLRELADASGSPETFISEIRVELISQNSIPSFASQAGAFRGTLTMVRTAYQLRGATTSLIIDTGLNEEMAREFGKNTVYYPDAFRRVQGAMSNASVVAVTHEHADHIAGIALHPNPASFVDELRLTSQQYDALGKFAPSLHKLLQRYEPLELVEPTVIAPGVVMIGAAGHTPGSVMFYVRLRSGEEILFIGDVAWWMENVRAARGRPRFVQQLFMHTAEDRSAVLGQLRSLHEIYVQGEVLIVASHDEEQFNQLLRQNVIKQGFNISP
jgi:glyoxylase-like metal-dependent hydrolase (beta-lactamase superfamily II)